MRLLADATILEHAAGDAAGGELTSEELVTYYVDRIQRYDMDRLNSVMELNPQALEIARQLDAERAAGKVRGDMHGIPVLLKDNIATGDEMHTTAGAYALKDWQPDRDAFLVQQLRDAGRDHPGQGQPVGVGELHGPLHAERFQRPGRPDPQPLWPVRDLWLQQRFGSLRGSEPGGSQRRQ